MAKSDTPSFDDLDSVEENKSTAGVREITLDPGEEVVGDVLYRLPGQGNYGADIVLLDLDGDVVLYKDSGHVQRQLESFDVSSGDILGLRKQEEKDGFEDSDGESVEYYPVKVGAEEGDA